MNFASTYKIIRLKKLGHCILFPFLASYSIVKSLIQPSHSSNNRITAQNLIYQLLVMIQLLSVKY